MTRIDLAHHKLAGLIIALVVFVVGVLFGARIGTASGSEGLLVLLFGLGLLNVCLSLVLFMQVVHLRDEHARDEHPKTAPSSKKVRR